MKKTLLVVAGLAMATMPLSAQTSRYYVHDGDNQIGFILQGGALVSSYTLPSSGGSDALYALRFQGSNFLTSNRRGSRGVEFDANGNPTGNTTSHAQSVDQMLDGTTDGTYTYSANCCGTGGIYRGDFNFGGLSSFALTNVNLAGVTFGAGSLWASDFSGYLYQLDMLGVVQNTYDTQVPYLGALAFESATNTIWGTNNRGGYIYQFDLSGNQLQNHYIPEIEGHNIWGGEMASSVVATPEPATMALLAPGLLGIIAIGRRRRSKSQ